MTTGFFSRLFGRKLDLESIRAEIRRIEQEIREKFDADAFRNGDWFLDNFQSFVERYRNFERLRELEAAHPGLNEDQLADLLIDDAVRTATLAGGATGAVVSAAELTGLMTWGLSLTVGAVSALAEVVYMVNVQLQLTFDIAALNQVTVSVEEPEEMLVTFASALGAKNLDLRGEGEASELLMLAKAAGMNRLYKELSNRIGRYIVRQVATKYALPVLNIGLGAYFSRSMTSKVGQVAKTRFGKLRTMRERLFEMRSRVGDRQKDVLLVALGYLQSDGLLTLEEIYLLRELARNLQASALWQQILAGEIPQLESGEFIDRFREPAYFDERELMLGVLQVLGEAKMRPNEKEGEFLHRLVAG